MKKIITFLAILLSGIMVFIISGLVTYYSLQEEKPTEVVDENDEWVDIPVYNPLSDTSMMTIITPALNSDETIIRYGTKEELESMENETVDATEVPEVAIGDLDEVEIKTEKPATTNKPSTSVKVETPKTETPKTQQPKVETPKVEVPVVEVPKVEEPKVEAPVVEVPKVEEPKVETPVVEVPKVEEPKVEAPVVEAPKVEEPKVEAPKVEEPKVEAPVVEAPKVEEPKVEAPVVEVPKVEEPVVEINPNVQISDTGL